MAPIARGVRAKALAGLLGPCALVSACGSATQPGPPQASLRIEKLSGSVVRLGSWEGRLLYGVRLRATVCARVTDDIYPEFGIRHFLVSRKHWFQVRSVVDRPPWLVPLGEAWLGKPCGPVRVDDPIPPEHYGGVESLGNPLSCYGVRLTIKGPNSRASKRVIIQCGGIGG
jgi:hypothetical protein